MNFTKVGLALLSTYAVSCSAFCVIKVSCRVYCTKLPVFEGCLQTQLTLNLVLAGIYHGDKFIQMHSELFSSLQMLLNHRFKFQFSYDQLGRSVELQMFADNCCINDTNPFLTVTFDRTESKSCPSYLLNKSLYSTSCIPNYFSLYNILIEQDVVVIRSNRYGFLFVTEENSPEIEHKLSLFGKIFKPGMWFGINTMSGIPEDSCNCSMIEKFAMFYEKCNRFLPPLVYQTVETNYSSSTSRNSSSTKESSPRNVANISNGWNPPSSVIFILLVCTMVVVLAALLIQEVGCHLRSNRVRPSA